MAAERFATYRKAVFERIQISPSCPIMHVTCWTCSENKGKRENNDHQKHEDLDDRCDIFKPRKGLVWQRENEYADDEEDCDW
jgi:hypothetical protein